MTDNRVFRCILVADDGSPEGEKAARTAVELAAKLHSEVILLGIVESPNIQAEGEGLPMKNPADRRHTLEVSFENALTLGKQLGVKIMLEIVEGKPSEQISDRASKHHVDLVVVGRRHLSRIQRWMEGSTSEAVLKKAGCAVMVIQ